MAMEPTTYWLKENLLFVKINEKSIILDIAKKTHYLPNETAAFILQFMVAGVRHDDLVNKLKATYGIDDVKAENAIKAVVDHESKSISKDPGSVPDIAKFPPPSSNKWEDAHIGPAGTVACVGNIVIQKISYL